MIEIYKTFQGELKKIDKPEEGCWINVCSPTEEEKKYLTDDFDQRLIMIDYP